MIQEFAGGTRTEKHLSGFGGGQVPFARKWTGRIAMSIPTQNKGRVAITLLTPTLLSTHKVSQLYT